MSSSLIGYGNSGIRFITAVFFAGLVYPLRTLFVDREILAAQMIGIGEGQSCEVTKDKHVPNAIEPIVGHLFTDQQIEFRFSQRRFYVGFIDLHFLIPERILFDLFVADGVEDKVFQAAKQVHYTIVIAVMRRLQEGIETVDIFVIHER